MKSPPIRESAPPLSTQSEGSPTHDLSLTPPARSLVSPRTGPLLQEKTGSREGSWDASRGLAGSGGRVASTALATLSLEVYYRLLPMYGFRGDEAPAVKEKSPVE